LINKLIVLNHPSFKNCLCSFKNCLWKSLKDLTGKLFLKSGYNGRPAFVRYFAIILWYRRPSARSQSMEEIEKCSVDTIWPACLENIMNRGVNFCPCNLLCSYLNNRKVKLLIVVSFPCINSKTVVTWIIWLFFIY